ncbi:MAG: beta-lactamase family protein [Desulfobacteraceae bacterium]|nr:beta-lactamase family protein [Desulfobacteraceae bacterium]
MTRDDTTFDAVDRLMRHAVRDGVFPGGVLLVAAGERVVFHRPYGAVDRFGGPEVTPTTLFDLASLTKPLATTMAVMRLVQDGLLDPMRPVASVLKPFAGGARSEVLFSHLLCHTSGLPDWRPYYRELVRRPAGERRHRLRQLLSREPLQATPGSRTLYSDLGFMVLCWALETITGTRLDHWVAENVYRPAGVEDLFFIPLDEPAPEMTNRSVAATEQCPWRGRVLRGEVHDDNAHAAGGVEGHAGLFGTAASVHRLLADLLRSYRGEPAEGGFEPELVRAFLRRPKDSQRVFGFDVPSGSESACGSRFSKDSVGHLGFTGTSFWMDLRKEAIVILLTNRVHPSRDNTVIRSFRPVVHDAVMKALFP